VTFTNGCAHTIHIHRYWTAAGSDGKVQNHRRLIVLTGPGDSRHFTDCPDGRTDKLLVSVPQGEQARCK
jgi:hypothetical protein